MTSGDLGSPAGPSRNTPDEGADGALVAVSATHADASVSATADDDRTTDELPERSGAPRTGSGEDRRPPSTLRLLVVVLVLAALIRALLLQIFFIPSSSMMPTLAPGDRIAVEKVTLRFDDLDRTDIVVFADPSPSPEVATRPLPVRLAWGAAAFVGVPDPGQTALVKRVIGLPGETVEIDARGGLIVDGRPVDEPYVRNPQRQAYGPVTVPAGHLLVLGDNRPGSDDSRGSLGFVDEDLVVGRVAGIIWPLDRVDAVPHSERTTTPD